MENQPIGNHGLGIFWCGQILPWTPPSRSNEDSQTKMLITRLLLVVEVWDGKPTYRKSCRFGMANQLKGNHYVHPPGGWIYYFCFFRRPMSDVRCPMSDVRRPASGVRCPASRMVSAHLKEKY